jgi:2-C-methyl-D-erythritol 4-phosphate cytidylyltransferase
LVLVLPEPQIGLWKELCIKHNIVINYKIAIGGTSRTESVKNGLAELTDRDAVIAIHDAVRPLISHDLIKRLYDSASEFGSSVPVVPVNDSIRKVNSNGVTSALDRSDYLIVQTPQVFNSKVLRSAYESTGNQKYTDDAAVVEQFGESIKTCAGETWNIKITQPEDMVVAEALIASAKPL